VAMSEAQEQKEGSVPHSCSSSARHFCAYGRDASRCQLQVAFSPRLFVSLAIAL